jgi:hypothetical protein
MAHGAGLVENEGSGVIILESSGVSASDWETTP